MRIAKMQPRTKTTVIVTVLAVAFSSMTIWLIDSWIKYPFFVIETISVITLWAISERTHFKSSLQHMRIDDCRIGLLIDFFLIISALSLLGMYALQVQVVVVQPVLALLCTSLLSGHALLDIFGLNTHFSKLEKVVLSYIFSYIFTGFMTLVSLQVETGTRLMILLVSYAGLGLISVVRQRRCAAPPLPNSYARGIDSLILILPISFIILCIIILYPGLAMLPTTDISRHYANSLVLWRTPELFMGFNYLLFNLHEAAFIAISNAPVAIVQTTLITLNLMIPLAFYAMSRPYLERIDARLPAISTIFYTIFSSFAWIDMVRLRLEGFEGSEFSLLSTVNDATYSGASYVSQPLIWYGPFSVSFIILMVQLLLLRKQSINGKSFVMLFSLLTVASVLTHVVDAIILSFFLCCYALFSHNRNIRLKDAVLASMLGFIVTDASYVVAQFVFGVPLDTKSVATAVLATIALAMTSTYRRFQVEVRITTYLHRLNWGALARNLAYVVFFAIIVGLPTWFILMPVFHQWQVDSIGFVPWFMYPVMLGILSVLGAIGFLYSTEDKRAVINLMPFVSLAIFSILLGRLLTYLNLISFVGYQEGRLMAYVFLALSVIAPIALVRIFDDLGGRSYLNNPRSQKRPKSKEPRKVFLSSLLIGFVLMSGFQSTVMVTEYWQLLAIDPNMMPSQNELQALEFMHGLYAKDKNAWALTLSPISVGMLAFAGPPWIELNPNTYVSAMNPEIPLLVIKASPPGGSYSFSHPFLYIADRDAFLSDVLFDSWLSGHFIPLLPRIYENDDATIYNVSDASYPQISSPTSLIVPFDGSLDPTKSWLYAYDLLSMGKYDYTTSFDLDENIFQRPTLVLPFDVPKEDVVQRYFEDIFGYPDGSHGEPVWHTASIVNDSGYLRWTKSFRVEGGLMLAGLQDKHESGALLADASVANFSAEVETRLLEFDPELENAAMIVYAYSGPSDYRAFVVSYGTDGYIHIYLFKMVRGVGDFSPARPGMNTGMKYTQGTSVRIIGEVKGTAQTLTVVADGKNFTTSYTDSNQIGRVGIVTQNAFSQTFDNFKVNGTCPIQFRKAEEYANYVIGGGHLIVLNMNGYGYFADEMLSIENTALTTNRVQGSSVLALPVNLTLPKVSAKNASIATTAFYGLPQNQSAYSVNMDIGLGTVTYVNLFPLIGALRASSAKAAFHDILGELLVPTNISLAQFGYISKPSVEAVYRQVTFSGAIEVSTSSVIFPLDLVLSEIIIAGYDGSISRLFNVTGIQMARSSGIRISTSFLTSGNGKGFYSLLGFRGNVSIEPQGISSSVVVSTGNGSEFTVPYRKLEIVNFSSLMYAREPYVECQGSALFEEMYSSGAIYEKTLCQGRALNVTGTVQVSAYLSDTYSYASSIVALGLLTTIPPMVAFIEASTLSLIVFYGLFLILAMLILPLLINTRRATPESAKSWEKSVRVLLDLIQGHRKRATQV